WRAIMREMVAEAAGSPGRRHAHGHGPMAHMAAGAPGGFPRGMFGPGGPWRGRKARRGDIRAAALLLLAEEPRNGYQIMQEVGERSGGLWRPSPGSVYPALQQLEDEGLIRTDEIDGRRVYRLTEQGEAEAAAWPKERPAPWDAMSAQGGDAAAGFGQALRAVAVAAAQVRQMGDDAQIARANAILDAARRDLYRVLAGDDAQAGYDAQAGDGRQPGDGPSSGG
ncbi:MAG: PadR family transcriptional regulator, partial [Acidobacteriota bacterium]|nr:PadR family transcriptional regulator [Acidobacteriota bacterium]